ACRRVRFRSSLSLSLHLSLSLSLSLSLPLSLPPSLLCPCSFNNVSERPFRVQCSCTILWNRAPHHVVKTTASPYLSRDRTEHTHTHTHTHYTHTHTHTNTHTQTLT